MRKRKKRDPKPLPPLVNKIWLAALLLFPVVLWIMPADFFDNSEVILCPSRLFFDVECLGCGITRAIMHLHHFELEEALYYNALCLLIYPGLIAVWAIWVRNAYRDLKNPPAVSATA